MELFIRYFCFLLVSITIVYGIGYLFEKITRLQSQKFYPSLFLRLLGGVSTLVFAVSFFKTGGKTVNTGLLLATLALIYLNRSGTKPKTDKITHRGSMFRLSEWIPFFMVILVIFTIRFYGIYDTSGILFLPNSDTLFHANVSCFIWSSGTESISLDYLNLFPRHQEPYHYFDLWLNAVVFQLFGLNALISYILVTVSLLLVICWCGFMALAGYYRQPSGSTCLFSFAFLFFSGIYLPFFKEIPWLVNANVFTVDLFNYNKLAVIMMFAQASLLFFIRRRQAEGVWLLLMLPVVFISTSVSVMASLTVFIILKYLEGRDRKLLLQSAGMMAAVTIYLYFFYTSDQEGQTIKIRQVEGGFISLITPEYLKTCLNIIGLTSIQMVVIFLPLILLLPSGINLLKRYLNPLRNPYLLLFLLLFSLSLMAWAALHYMVDTVQLFSNITMVSIALLIFMTVQFLLSKIGGVQRLLLFAVVFSVCGWKFYHTFSMARTPWPQSREYLIKTSEALQGINPLGAFILAPGDYGHVFAKNPIFNIAGKHLAYANSKAYTYSLSVYDTPVSEDHPDTDRQLMSRSVFHRFTENMKDEGNFKSVPDAQVRFIRKYKIEYLIAAAGAEPDTLIKKLITSVITDEITGERFFLLSHRQAGENPLRP